MMSSHGWECGRGPAAHVTGRMPVHLFGLLFTMSSGLQLRSSAFSSAWSDGSAGAVRSAVHGLMAVQ